MFDLSATIVRMRHIFAKFRFLLRHWVILAALAGLGVFVAGWVGYAPYLRWRVEHFRPMVERHAAAYELDAALVMAIITAESGGDANATSDANAKGLMQITPITVAEVVGRRRVVGPGDLYDPDYNLSVGCAYLAQLWRRFEGDPVMVMVAYHMGPTKVSQWRQQHPGADGRVLLADQITGPKTRAYVKRVLVEWEDWREVLAEAHRQAGVFNIKEK